MGEAYRINANDAEMAVYSAAGVDPYKYYGEVLGSTIDQIAQENSYSL